MYHTVFVRDSREQQMEVELSFLTVINAHLYEKIITLVKNMDEFRVYLIVFQINRFLLLILRKDI